VTGDLEDLIVECSKDKVAGLTFVTRRRGQRFTEVWRERHVPRYCKRVGSKTSTARSTRQGGDDMYLAGEPMERIQMLLGHDSVTTTERYIKTRLPDAVMPNTRLIKSELRQICAL